MTPITMYATAHGERWPLREVRAGDRAITVTPTGLQVVDQSYRKVATGDDAATVTADLLALSARNGDSTVLVFENGVVEVYPTSQLPILGLIHEASK